MNFVKNNQRYYWIFGQNMAFWNSGAVLKMSAWLGPWLCFDEGGLAKQSRVECRSKSNYFCLIAFLSLQFPCDISFFDYRVFYKMLSAVPLAFNSVQSCLEMLRKKHYSHSQYFFKRTVGSDCFHF